jgi:hypothetical protein
MPGSASADVPSVSNRGGSLFANVTNSHTLVFGTATDYVIAPAKLIDKSSDNVWNDDFTLIYGTVEGLGSVTVNSYSEPTINTASISHFSSSDLKNWGLERFKNGSLSTTSMIPACGTTFSPREIPPLSSFEAARQVGSKAPDRRKSRAFSITRPADPKRQNELVTGGFRS